MKIKKTMSQRGIGHLVHFTRAENLQSIFEKGLCPRDELSEKKAIFNDEFRFDRCTNAVCTSIEFPNYKMFYALRQQDPGAEWAVLGIDADVLLDFKCAFCERNAGSTPMFTMPLEDRMGGDAFQNLFKDESDGRKRADLKIPDWFPTNPQAEVLVFGTIPVEYITHAAFDDEDTLKKYKACIPEGVKGIAEHGLFAPRMDYEKWK